MLRVIREVRPQWVVGENVLGIVNWDGGLVFDQVQAELEVEGYEVQPYVLPACAVNAPHRRDRVWFVARRIPRMDEAKNGGDIGTILGQDVGGGVETPRQPSNEDKTTSDRNRTRTDNRSGLHGEKWAASNPNSDGLNGCNCEHEINSGQRRIDALGNSEPVCERDAADTNGLGQSGEEHRKTEPGQFAKESRPTDWTNFPTVSPVHFRNDGLPDRLVGITFPKWRNEGIKACGNAIVPQVVLQIFNAINLFIEEQK